MWEGLEKQVTVLDLIKILHWRYAEEGGDD